MGLILHADGRVEEVLPKGKDGEFSLAEMQSAVKGEIEMIDVSYVKNNMFHYGALVINDKGVILGLKPNPTASLLLLVSGHGTDVVGDALFCFEEEFS